MGLIGSVIAFTTGNGVTISGVILLLILTGYFAYNKKGKEKEERMVYIKNPHLTKRKRKP